MQFYSSILNKRFDFFHSLSSSTVHVSLKPC